jgi:hypothetical protein
MPLDRSVTRTQIPRVMRPQYDEERSESPFVCETGP